MDRASDSDSESRGFDSLHAYIDLIIFWSNLKLKTSDKFLKKGAALVLTFKR